MLKARHEPNLALEALRAEARRHLGMQHLQRDRPIVLQVMGQIDRGHAASPELALERIAVSERVAQSCRHVRQRHLPFCEVSGKSVSRGALMPPADEY